MKALRVASRGIRLPWREQRQVLVAAALLARVSVALKLMPFSKAILLGSVPIGGKQPDSRTVDESVRAVRRASYTVPWRTVCIHEGLALQHLLRSHGVPAILRYGTNRLDGELKSHVWVTVGNEIVIGGEEAPRFHLLASYPRVTD
jgi:hypothetical protein